MITHAILSRNELAMVPYVPFTETWKPWHHVEIMEKMDSALRFHGIGVKGERLSVTRDGLNMFASMTLDIQVNGVSYMLGVRNSMAKKFAVGICAGTKVTVCSNMMFKGDEFITFRKHTSGLNSEMLVELFENGIITGVHQCRQLDEWHSALRHVRMTNNSIKEYSFDLFEQRAIPASQFNEYADALRSEMWLNGETLYAAHGAATRTLREKSPMSILNKTTTLNQVTDQWNNVTWQLA